MSWRPADVVRVLLCLGVLPAAPLLTVEWWAPERWGLGLLFGVCLALHLVGGSLGWAAALRWMGRAPHAPNVAVFALRLLVARITRAVALSFAALLVCLPAIPVAGVLRLPFGAVAGGRPLLGAFDRRLWTEGFRAPALLALELALFGLELVVLWPAVSIMAFEGMSWPVRIALALAAQLYLFWSLAAGSAGAAAGVLDDTPTAAAPAGPRWMAAALGGPLVLGTAAMAVSDGATFAVMVKARMLESRGEWQAAAEKWRRVPGPWMPEQRLVSYSRCVRMTGDADTAYAWSSDGWASLRAGSLGRGMVAIELGMACIDQAWDHGHDGQRAKFREAVQWFERGAAARRRDRELDAVAAIWDAIARAGAAEVLPEPDVLDAWFADAPEERGVATYNLATAIRNRGDERAWDDNVEAYRVAERLYAKTLADPGATAEVRRLALGDRAYAAWQAAEFEQADALFAVALAKLESSELAGARVDFIYFLRDWASRAEGAEGPGRLGRLIDAVDQLLAQRGHLDPATEATMRAFGIAARAAAGADAPSQAAALQALCDVPDLAPADRADALAELGERAEGDAGRGWVPDRPGCRAIARRAGRRYLAEAPPDHPRRPEVLMRTARMERAAGRRDEATRLFEEALASPALGELEAADVRVQLARLDWRRLTDGADADVARRGLRRLDEALQSGVLEGVSHDEAVWFRAALLGGIGEWDAAKQLLREALNALPAGSDRRAALLREQALLWSRFVVSDGMPEDPEAEQAQWRRALAAADAYLAEVPPGSGDHEQIAVERAWFLRGVGEYERAMLAASELVARLDVTKPADQPWIESAADLYRDMAGEGEVDNPESTLAQAARWYRALVPELRDPAKQGLLHAHIAWCLWGQSLYAEAEAAYGDAEVLCRRGGDQETRDIVRRNVGHLLLDWVEDAPGMAAQDRTDRLFRARALALEGFEALSPWRRGVQLIQRARVSVALGEIETARADLDRALAVEGLSKTARLELVAVYAREMEAFDPGGPFGGRALPEAEWGWSRWLALAPPDAEGRKDAEQKRAALRRKILGD